MWHLLRRTAFHIRNEGLAGALRRGWHRLADPWYEWRLGIRSAAYIRLPALGINDPACHDYEPTAFADVWRILRHLPIEPGRAVLLDYGAGMGRMLAAAAMHPFRRVIGIELIPELHTIAQGNIARLQDRLQCPQVELINADACEYPVPADVTVIYIFNAFSGWVLERVLEQIRRSVEISPRRVTLVFCAPPECSGDPLGQQSWLAPTHTLPGFRNRTIWFYETLPLPAPIRSESLALADPIAGRAKPGAAMPTGVGFGCGSGPTAQAPQPAQGF